MNRPFANFEIDTSERHPHLRGMTRADSHRGWLRISCGTVLFCVVGLGVYSYVAEPFLPDPKLFAFVKAHELILMVGLALFMFAVALIMPPHPSSPKGPGSRITVALMVAAIGIFAPDIARSGLPAFHAGMKRAQEGEQVVTVVEKGRSSRRRRCDKVAKVTWPGAEDYSVSICGIPYDIHRNLRPGQKLRLTGQQTKWGIRYFDIEKAG